LLQASEAGEHGTAVYVNPLFGSQLQLMQFSAGHGLGWVTQQPFCNTACRHLLAGCSHEAGGWQVEQMQYPQQDPQGVAGVSQILAVNSRRSPSNVCQAVTAITRSGFVRSAGLYVGLQVIGTETGRPAGRLYLLFVAISSSCGEASLPTPTA